MMRRKPTTTISLLAAYGGVEYSSWVMEIAILFFKCDRDVVIAFCGDGHVALCEFFRGALVCADFFGFSIFYGVWCSFWFASVGQSNNG